MTQRIEQESRRANSASYPEIGMIEGPLYHSGNIAILNFLAIFSVCVLIWLLKPGLSSTSVVNQLPQTLSCDEGYIKLDGRCYRQHQTVRDCQNLDPCSASCECSSARGMACNSENICTFNDDYTIQQFCKQPGKKKFVAELDKLYSTCRSKTASKQDAIGCPAEDFDKFLLEHKNFHLYLKEFNRNAVSFHFDESQPQNLDGPWFSRAKKHMKGELQTSIKGLNEAHMILLVGTSSPGGTSPQARQANVAMTQRRMAAARKMLVESGVTTPIVPFPLADKRPLTPSDFEALSIRYIAWSASEADFLRESLEGFDKLSKNRQDKVTREINQAVFIIPIPCAPDNGRQRK